MFIFYVSVHFSPKSSKQIENLSFGIFKKKVRLLILTFRFPKIRAFHRYLLQYSPF